ncbi:M4 family metallopeptidase [Streptomyces sp. TLI_105]|uniref:M4 family metallopeptidase n=1 Tax=Streptomyces sp. TLI_105 TaxID=1881019 RepID=UPI000896F8E7|nr:M4 family metallopeptidase [Streptomyces sp. TLI_105]SEB65157.1 thermolysin Metallo peptidase. MEROPS family M04 [Streptomyces sp. TLI_105]
MSTFSSAGSRARRLALTSGAVVLTGGLLAVGATTAAAGPAPVHEGTPVAVTAQSLGLGAKEKLVVKDVIKDADGTVHTRYDRTYAGLPVLGGDLIVHRAADGAVKDVTKAVQAAIEVDSLTPKLTATAAESAAVRAARAAKTAGAATGEAPRKVIWAAAGTPVLAYETVVTGTQQDGVTPSLLRVVTDADTGKKLYENQLIDGIADGVTGTTGKIGGSAAGKPGSPRTGAVGTGVSQYSGAVSLNTTASSKGYDLVDNERGGSSTVDLQHRTGGKGTLFTDADNAWGDGTPAHNQTAAVDAAYGAAQTWDFYKNVLHRNGIKNDGRAPVSKVHYGNAYQNAFWDDRSFTITYGDGANNQHPLTQLDVAGHEFSHGVTSATANLQYSGESGGLNEATSDIFGTAVEWNANNAQDPGDYLLGEKIDIFGNGKPLRHQDQPSKDGRGSADYWSAGVGNLDVHYSSGVANHFFYLLSEGSGAKDINGVHYDSPTVDGSTVTGIGRDKAVQIWYKALTAYFTSTTDYHGAREGSLKAASDLYGADSAEVKAVDAAWAAVNVKA